MPINLGTQSFLLFGRSPKTKARKRAGLQSFAMARNRERVSPASAGKEAVLNVRIKKVSEGALTSFLLSNAAFTKTELIKALNISSASVGLLINELLDKGVIERDPQYQKGHFIVKA